MNVARSRHGARPELLAILPGLTAFGISVVLAFDLITYKLVGFDLAAYILAARRLQAGEALYQTNVIALGPFGQFVYPPPVAIAFVPLAALPFDLARAVGLAFLIALAAVLIWRLTRVLPRTTRYWAAAAMVLFFPLIWEVTLENLTLVTLMLCLLAWRLRRSQIPGGISFAGAVGLKLLPLALFAFFLVAGHRRMVAWSAVALATIALVTWPIVGHEWAAFLGLLRSIAEASPGTGSNVAPVLFAAPPLRSILPGLAVAIAIVCGAIARVRDEREDHAFRVALAAVPLVAATLWYPYLIFALPLLIARGPRPRVAALRWPFRIARPASWLMMEVESLSDPGREFLLPLIGLLLLIALGLLELAWGERDGSMRFHRELERELEARPALEGHALGNERR